MTGSAARKSRRAGGVGSFTIDELVKSRHPGESRGPVLCNELIFLDTGFRRYDVVGGFSTFYDAITIDCEEKA
jgi:hypothetical protein